MTTPRIEEMVEVEKTIDEEINEIIDALVADVHFEKTWPSHTTYYQINLNQFHKKLQIALTEAHQAGIDEALEKINKKYWLNPKRSKKDTAKDNAWNDLGNTLRNGV